MGKRRAITGHSPLTFMSEWDLPSAGIKHKLFRYAYAYQSNDKNNLFSRLVYILLYSLWHSFDDIGG